MSGCATTSSETPKEAPAATIAAEPAPVAGTQTPATAGAKPASSKRVQQRVRPSAAAEEVATEVPAELTAALTEEPATLVDTGPTIDDASTADGTSTIAGLVPNQYPDVFDRIRAGFKLEDVESRQIDQQLAFFANNPAYLERVFGRASLYMHHIVQEIEARGMPLELALLPVIESAFEPYARSWATANGLWQFMPGTGERFGLKQDWWYDGRRDVLASTKAALDY
ncbi:MAG: hypothetical protein K0Q92_2899, partial [Steroidobacteraceae bacterium]|nr:hypothetical protein [Steroidobacteraceae bacterium]